MTHVRGVVASVVLALTTSLPAMAAEAEATRCASAAERGQKQRDEGRLLESRATFVSCGEAVCPNVIRRECLHWLAEVDERIPSLVLSVTDASGKDVPDAEVTVDGRRQVGNLGRELLLDPGPHHVTARRGGAPPSEETVVLRERERGRAVGLVLRAPVSSSAPPPPPVERSRPVPVFTWVLAGTAVAGGGAFGYLWSTGVDQVHDLRRSCAPDCAQTEVDDASTLLRAGRISLAIGITAAVGAVVVYLLRPSESVRTAVSGSTLGLRF